MERDLGRGRGKQHADPLPGSRSESSRFPAIATVNRSSGEANFTVAMMSNDIFDMKILIDKLMKLNTSQQSIESLSRWCIAHQKKARQIVETWEKLLNRSQKEQHVSFLFLANDILQNSRRKGTEFVNEFWKILPGTLKNIHENGDEDARKAVSRLVNIWEERKVFGSRLQNLKDEILGMAPPVQLESNGRSSNPIKIVKKDSQSLRIKLNVGDLLEKIVMTYHSVHDANPNEEDALANCNTAVLLIERIGKDVDDATAKGIEPHSTVLDQLQEQGNILQQYVEQLESAEASRVALLDQLKAAIHEQETKLSIVHHQLQTARSQIEVAGKIKQKLWAAKITSSTPLMGATEPVIVPGHGKATVQASTGGLQLSGSQSTTVLQFPSLLPQESASQAATSFAALAPTEEENKKAAAAAVAAKLTASSSSAMMLTAVLSSLVAEEAAARNGNSGNASFTSTLPSFSPEKRRKLESDSSNSDIGYFTRHHQSMPGLPPVPTNMKPMSPSTQMPASLPPVSSLPPLPPTIPLPNSPANQFLQSSGMMLGPIPYGYSGGSLPPPSLMQSNVAMTLPRPPPHAQELQMPLHPQQQQSGSGGYYVPSGFGSHGQGQQPTTTPVHRQ